MRTAQARGSVRLAPSETLALWSDVERWPSFVEGFARLLELSPDWPAKGARVVWESTPEGRGRVTETITDNRADRFSTQVFEDALIGTQTLRAIPASDGSAIDGSAIDGSASDGSAIELTLEYELAKYGPLASVADAIFIRRALRDALRRTLFRFRIEAEEEAELG